VKIEIGESLIYSWLRHVKGCQIAQINWKSSPSSWDLKNREVLEKLMFESADLFATKYAENLFKGTSSLEQLLRQAEIDVLGVKLDGTSQHLYAVDIAVHGGGMKSS